MGAKGLKLYLNKNVAAEFLTPDAYDAAAAAGKLHGRNSSQGAWRIFTWDQCEALLAFVLDSSCVEFGGKIYHQRIGIPMGGNASVFFANHFLFAYEL
jgi:hypothetical protein